ncbi:MAG TPA: DUF4893 domain-containing protein [Allosphingosinicella sp.]|jgi:hypothetical protein
MIILPLLIAAVAQAPTCTAPEETCDPRTRAERRVRTWRQVATEDDRRRIRQWREAFVAALGEARTGGHGAEIDREGALLEPDVALPGAALPAGDYRCRTLKLGSQGEGGLEYVPYSPFRCRVARGADGLWHFTKTSGSQRPIGRLYPEHDRRRIFLGTMQLGDEMRIMTYGRDRERNLAGIVERIGERRWRILFPYPHFESTLDVIELVPER